MHTVLSSLSKRQCLLVIFLLPLVATVTAFHVKPVSRSTSVYSELKASSSASRPTRSTPKTLQDWTANGDGNAAGIRIGGLSIQESKYGGLGLVVATEKGAPPNTVLVSVPSAVALTVDNSSGPNDSALMDLAVRDRKALRDAPWFVQFSIFVQALDKISSKHGSAGSPVDLQPWLDSLPRAFDTPIHWTSSAMDELQYSHLLDSVARQEREWTALYNDMERIANAALGFNYDRFVWGCECARSRAFSGTYTGSAFNPGIYAFTLLLVTAYVGLGFGTLEQAANGAGLVFCATVFKDFIVPKLFKTKKYVICPVIDMANHNSLQFNAEVSFEYFADTYSLATTSSTTAEMVGSGSEVMISYGARSNDQLLQYYGFVEPNNPHDVYVMPPLREWNIAALEQACGVESFAPGRLEKLNRAGLLGSSTDTTPSTTSKSSDVGMDDSSNDIVNPKGGVVVTRTGGMDPAVMQALRALVSTEDEWIVAGEAIGNFSVEMNPDNERRSIIAARKAIELELASKPTTLKQDLELWKRQMSSSSAMKGSRLDRTEELALSFRIEKKKLLHEVMSQL